MTFIELLSEMERAQIDPDAYDFEGRAEKDDVYCLERNRRGWAYYYRERGIRRDERSFDSEDVACRYFFERISGDPTTRIGARSDTPDAVC